METSEEALVARMLELDQDIANIKQEMLEEEEEEQVEEEIEDDHDQDEGGGEDEEGEEQMKFDPSRPGINSITLNEHGVVSTVQKGFKKSLKTQ